MNDQYPYLTLFALYFLGQALHLCFWDFPENRKSAKLANVPFQPKQVFLNDWFLWVGNMILCIILLIILDEWHVITPKITGKEKTLFALFGALFSFAIQSKWGRFKTTINHIVDQKTNIADGISRDDQPKQNP